MAFCPEDGFDVERLLAEADRRMYSMKQIHHAKRRPRAGSTRAGASLKWTMWNHAGAKLARHGIAIVATVLIGGFLSGNAGALAPRDSTPTKLNWIRD